MRALAATPVKLPGEMADRSFAVVGIEDVVETVAFLARRWAAGNRGWNADWVLIHPAVNSFGAVVSAFRKWLGGGGKRLFPAPAWLLRFGAIAGDAAGALGWRPPVRGNALQELRRGVTGDPGAWLAATRFEPRSLDEILAARRATVQEKWFARLYLLKPAIISVLVLFWAVSGLIALTVAFDAAVAILTSHGFPEALARAVTILSSSIDIAVGLAMPSAAPAAPACGLGSRSRSFTWPARPSSRPASGSSRSAPW